MPTIELEANSLCYAKPYELMALARAMANPILTGGKQDRRRQPHEHLRNKARMLLAHSRERQAPSGLQCICVQDDETRV